MTATTGSDLQRRAAARLSELGMAMGEQMASLTDALHTHLSEEITPLQGDQPLLDLLHASIESNLETVVHLLRYGIPVSDVSTPSAAEEYARRLAQRGISSTALVRAYRLGQHQIAMWACDELGRRESDPAVAMITLRSFLEITLGYIDSISEQVVQEYEVERERWLSNRNSVRVAMAEELLGGAQVDPAVAEQALGYRLRQHHVGVVLWSADVRMSASDLGRFERFLVAVTRAVGGEGAPLFLPRDRAIAWGWVPLGRSGAELPDEVLRAEAERAGGVRVAVGTPAAGAAGFRITHLEAERARQVSIAAAEAARPVTSYADPQVRTAALLAADPEGTRRLVGKALGALAVPTEAAERLRDTLLAFLEEKGSYLATAERVHLHKNTVKYRVDKAVEERGRPLDEDRLELELALVAARWLGSSVLRRP